MIIQELIDRLEDIIVVEGQEYLEVFVVDDDHAYPLIKLVVTDQTDDPEDPPDIPSKGKGVYMIWLP